jgi:hypothetical protein
MHKFEIGQQVRITNYSHPHCGEFATVRSILVNGAVFVLALNRFGGRLVAATQSSITPAPSMSFDGKRPPPLDIVEDRSIEQKIADGDLPEVSRSSHYS